MQTLRELNLKILTLKKLSYTCKICKEIHQPDNLSYLIHLPYADLPPLNFPTNTYPKCEHIIHTQIVGVFYTNNGDYLKKLPSRTELSLHTEPENSHDSYAVSVWHNDKKCGYIPKEKNREIFTAITSNEKVKCILGRYHPKVDAKKVFHKHRTSHDREDRDFFDDYDDDFYGNYEEVQKFQPERADTTITIVDYTTIKKVFDALVELNELGYPHLEQDFDRIGPNALSYLVWYANKSKAAERLLAIVQAHYQITTSQGYSLLH